MLLESVEYVCPESVDEALRALGAVDGAAVLAGGQSLLNVLKNRVASVEVLVDISRVPELRTIERGADGSLAVGACVTYDDLDRSADVRQAHTVLADVAGHIEDQQIRNRGTIGGNCCLGDPTNNLPPLLVALDATMNIRAARGTRPGAAGGAVVFWAGVPSVPIRHYGMEEALRGVVPTAESVRAAAEMIGSDVE